MEFKKWLIEAGVIAPMAGQLFVPPKQFDERRKTRKFLAWLKNLGVDVQKYIDGVEEGKPIEIPVPFSGGGVGAAYPMGNFVVKITGEEGEAKSAYQLAGKEEPGVAKIYDVIKIPGKEKTLYAIVQEKLKVGASKKVRVAGEVVYEYLDKFAQPLEDVNAAYKYIAKYLLPDKGRGWNNDPDVHNMIKRLLQHTKNIQDKYGFTYRDPHGGNIMIKNHQPTFFDLGRSSPTGKELQSPKSLL